MKKLNIITIRNDFPILKIKVNNKSLVYFDNAATTQKPYKVIMAISDFYARYNANIHRGIHSLSNQATQAFEQARVVVQKFIKAQNQEEIVFTRGTTEGINLVAATFGEQQIKRDDVILLSVLEHHANIVPWQRLAKKKGASLKIIPIDSKGQINLVEYKKSLNQKVKLIAVTQVSNSLGVINPIKQIVKLAHEKNIPVLVDGAQAIPHMRINVRDLDCDFYVFSGHKIYGPTGIGVLYAKKVILNQMEPYQSGGEMIKSVTFHGSEYKNAPFKFEAGTPNIAGAIGLAEAISYIENIGWKEIKLQENKLLKYATEQLLKIEGLKIIGTAKDKVPIISFVIKGIHPHDLGTILDQEGIAIRTGHHCNQPVMETFGVPATARVSMAFYNTTFEIDKLVKAIYKAKKIMKV